MDAYLGIKSLRRTIELVLQKLMAKMQEIKNKLLSEIKTIVDSTVGSNMQIADALKKENGGFLTDEQSAYIKNNVTVKYP